MNIHQSPQAAPSWLTQRNVSSPQALNDPTCPNCCGQALARTHVAREFRAFSCVFVHPVSGDVSCNLVQSRAISCDLVRSRTISCNLVRSRAISKCLVQSRALLCAFSCRKQWLKSHYANLMLAGLAVPILLNERNTGN